MPAYPFHPQFCWGEFKDTDKKCLTCRHRIRCQQVKMRKEGTVHMVDQQIPPPQVPFEITRPLQ